MNYIGAASTIGNKLSELYSDYERGKSARLGQYKGSNDMKKLGHYSKSGKALGIYHG